MFGVGMTELMVIFVIGLVILGPKRLPDLARSLGRSLAEFRRASNDLRREFMDVAEEAKIEPPRLEKSGRGEGEPRPDADAGEPGAVASQRGGREPDAPEPGEPSKPHG